MPAGMGAEKLTPVIWRQFYLLLVLGSLTSMFNTTESWQVLQPLTSDVFVYSMSLPQTALNLRYLTVKYQLSYKQRHIVKII